jgi:hypothetical protein
MSALADTDCRYKDNCDRCGSNMQAGKLHNWCTSQQCYCSDDCYFRKY